jgi:hypothetical protein
MPEEFEGDLHDAVFWGAELNGATFRYVDLTGVRITHSLVVDVDIDAIVDRVVINGVDVTDYVNERDRWYPLRAMVRAPDVDGMRAAWHTLESTWAPTIERARELTDEQLHESVNGEWSFLDTLRHLVFAIDKWCTVPLLGGELHPFGIPNVSSRDRYLALDYGSDPSLDEVLAVRADRAAGLRAFLGKLSDDDLDRVVEVSENGPNPVRECVFTVLEEEFWHHRYAARDLELLS